MATNWIDKMLQSRKIVDGKSWHYKVYQYWLGLTGGNPYDYKENLCHYTRVVVLWAPLNWFKYAQIYSFIRPWTIAYAVFLALPIYLYVRAAVELHLSLWQSVQLPLVYIIGIVGVFVTSRYLWKEDDTEDERIGTDKGWNWVLRFVSPLAIPFLLIVWFFNRYGWPQIKEALEWTWDKLIDPWLTPAVRWYFQKDLGRGFITPFTVTLCGAFVLATVRFTRIVLTILAVIACVVVALFLIWGVVKLIGLLREPLGQLATSLSSHKRSDRAKRPARPVSKVKHTSTFGLIATYFAALHRGVCPYIDLPAEEPTK